MRRKASRLFVSLFAITAMWFTIGCGSSPTDKTAKDTGRTSVSNNKRTSNDSDRSFKDTDDTQAKTQKSDAKTESSTSNGQSEVGPNKEKEVGPKKTETPKKSTSTSSAPTTGNGPTSTVDASLGSWGHLKGQFIYAGDPPPVTNLTITKDKEYCGKHDVPNETLVVNSENRGLANVAIFFYARPGSDPPPIHDSYAKSATGEVTMNNEKCRFEPHVCLLRTSQTLVVGNKDTVGHNTKIDAFSNAAINPITPAGESFKHQFSNVERSPVSVGCSIHPWMSGYLIVRDTPYFAVTDKDGKFEIKYLPEGKWTLQIWHEKAGAIGEVMLNGKKTQWKRGRAEVTLKPGEIIDWGKIELAAGLFED